MEDIEMSGTAPGQEVPVAGASTDASTRKRSRDDGDATQPTNDDALPSETDAANPTKRSRTDEGPTIKEPTHIVGPNGTMIDLADWHDLRDGVEELTRIRLFEQANPGEKYTAGGTAPVNDSRPANEGEDSTSPADAASTNDGKDAQPQLSKNQLRKLRRRQQFEDKRDFRKQLRKDKRHDKAAAKREGLEAKATELMEKLGIDKEEALKKVRREQPKEAPKSHRPVPVAIILDCDFEKYMRDNEQVSLASQVTRSYAMNRAGSHVAHLLVSSWGGSMKERFETTLRSHHKHWKGVKFVEGDFIEAGKKAWEIMNSPRGGKTCPALGETAEESQKISEKQPEEQTDGGEEQGPKNGNIEMSNATEVKDDVKTEEASGSGATETTNNAQSTPPFSTDSIVYLSADSPNTLDKLEPNTSYVIGGLVDRNREKFLCQRRAEEMGIRTAKLPIGDYMQMSSRKVLATNHVVEIISKWLETGDWGTAFMEVIPQRKGGQLKIGEAGDDHQDDEQDVDDVEDEEELKDVVADKDKVKSEEQETGAVESEA